MEPVYTNGTTEYAFSSDEFPLLNEGYNSLYTFSDATTYYYVRVSKSPIDFLSPVRVAFFLDGRCYVSTNLNPAGGAVALPLGVTDIGLFYEGDPALVIQSLVPGPSLLVASYGGFLSPRSGYVSQV
uniref:Uncharacterized protein n=1 Tax=viral metagenome TaxID=1070528 RepID=A0A2V0RKF7_9ZZZZ